MDKKVLYIIGNGFDLHFGIKSSYSDFEEYVKKNDNQLYVKLSEYFNNEELWSDFERTLADIDVDAILDYANNFLPSYGADDWSDSGHHDYQYEIDQITSAVTKDLKKIFTDWILKLKMPEDLSINLPQKALYLVFNYTDTIV